MHLQKDAEEKSIKSGEESDRIFTICAGDGVQNMEKISFETIKDSLNCGREIEFSYQNKQYSITNSQGYWNFCCDTDNRTMERICPFADREALMAWVSALCIEGTPLPCIFDEEKYEASSVCIL